MIGKDKIYVTKTFLPPQEEYSTILKEVFDSHWLTNRGKLALALEEKIKKKLNVRHMFLLNNGTIPIQIALKLFGNGGEIITTPFSYVATTSSIVWEGCTPVFVDIDPTYLSIDETKIQASITPRTKAILATHVYGNPCNVEAIAAIAKQHNIKVIYDAAHCFGVSYKGSSLFNYGDISTCSFHATKVFHTGEGGAIFCDSDDIFHHSYYAHNFGHDGPLSFHGLGVNGKISELQAAMGLSVLPYMDHILAERKRVVEAYDQMLNFNKIDRLAIRPGTDWNHSYYPIFFGSEEALLVAERHLNGHGIYPRRYFYPSLNTLPYVEYVKMPVSESIAKRVLCLPLHTALSTDQVTFICNTINDIV